MKHVDGKYLAKYAPRRGKSKQSNGKILVVGNFSPNGTANSLEALKLAVGMIDDGQDVQTVSPYNSAFSQRQINFRTPQKFRRSTAFLSDYQISIVFLDAMKSAPMRSKTQFGKVREQYRKLEFLRTIRQRSKKMYFVGSTNSLKTAKYILRLSPDRLFESERSAELITKDLIGTHLIAMDLERAQTTICNHANFTDADGLFTPLKLERLFVKNGSIDPHLAKICLFARNPKLRKSSLVKQLTNPIKNNAGSIQHTAPPFRAKDLALRNDPIHGIPQYALHLRSVLKLEEAYPLNSIEDKARFMQWYHCEARDKLGLQWIPTPTLETQNDHSSSTIVQLTDFLNDPSEHRIPTQALSALEHKKPEGTVNGLVLLLALLCKVPVSPSTIKDPWHCMDLQRWFNTSVLPIVPEFRKYARQKAPQRNNSYFAELIGLPSQETGLGKNINMSLQAIDKIGLNHIVTDIDADQSQRTAQSKAKREIKGNFALHHVNADRAAMSCMTPRFAHRNDVYHIGHFLWELSSIPKIHHLAIEMLDEIWTPSSFVKTLYKDAGARCVRMVGKGLPEIEYLKSLSKITSPNTEHFTVFMAFDFHSSVERKNPISALRAFQIAFPEYKFKHARLIIKTTPAAAGHWGDPNDQMSAIHKAARKDKRIKVIAQLIPKDHLFKMMARSNCIVSPHRGEGFGYIPAYALALRKPVIATNWGGNVDFCTPETSFPVGAKLVPVPKGHSIYEAANALWADISVDAMAQRLIEVHDKPQRAAKKARMGQVLIQNEYSMDKLAQTYEARLEEIGLI